MQHVKFDIAWRQAFSLPLPLCGCTSSASALQESCSSAIYCIRATGACIRLLRCTFKTCACQCQPPPVAVTYVQLTVTFGPRSFASSAPKLWNSLPLPLRDSTLTLRQFSSRLKTHLFRLAYGRASWLLRLQGLRDINPHTYIHKYIHTYKIWHGCLI